MQEIADLLANYGVSVVLIILFIYTFLEDRKERKDEKTKTTQVLKELSNSNSNIAESLNLLKTSIDNNTAEYRQHDDRAIQQFNNINEKLVKIIEMKKKGGI